MSAESRSKSINVDSKQLRKAWQQWLVLKDPGFSWTGGDYGKPTRAQGADREGLLLYKEALAQLLTLAPNGFPSHASLRGAIFSIDEEFDVLGTGANGKSRFRAAAEATDVWRVMCGDAAKLKRSGSWPAELDILMAALTQIAGSGSDFSPDLSLPPPPVLPPPPPPPPQVTLSHDLPMDAIDRSGDKSPQVSLSHDHAIDFEVPDIARDDPSSSDEVQFIGFKCRCPECDPSRSQVAGASSCSNLPGSAPSQVASASSCSKLPIPSPMRGQLQAAKPVRRLRCHGKTKDVTKAAMPYVTKAKKKAKKKATPDVSSRSEVQHMPFAMPVKTVNRLTGKAESYILQSRGSHSYVCGLTGFQTPVFRELIAQCCELIKDGQLNTPSEAKQWLHSQI